MATTSSLHGERRRELLLERLAIEGRVQLDEVAAGLDVSAMTVRRDLAELEAAGLLRRVRGGAVSVSRPRSFAERSATEIDAKRVIARKALAMVPRSGQLAFDASSTVGVLIDAIGDDLDVLAVTNSFENFRTASARPGVRAVLVGGEAERLTESFVGPLACSTAASLHYSRFFTSAAAVDATWGTSEVTPGEAQVKQIFAAGSDSTVLLVTSGKVGDRAVARALEWGGIDLAVTELDPRSEELDALRGLVELV